MAIRKLGADDGPRQYIEATLESIVSDASADNEYSLYKWTNYRRGGLLLESYAGTGGGVAEVNRMCKEQLINYMYLTGQGRTIAGSESLAWRRRRHLEVSP